jgi:hypothetical protein
MYKRLFERKAIYLPDKGDDIAPFAAPKAIEAAILKNKKGSIVLFVKRAKTGMGLSAPP